MKVLTYEQAQLLIGEIKKAINNAVKKVDDKVADIQQRVDALENNVNEAVSESEMESLIDELASGDGNEPESGDGNEPEPGEAAE